jgi:lipoate-protein ligase A
LCIPVSESCMQESAAMESWHRWFRWHNQPPSASIGRRNNKQQQIPSVRVTLPETL